MQAQAELAHKKQRKRRRVIWITATSSLLIVTLVLVAYLSSYVGNFTIRVRNSDTHLAIAQNIDATRVTKDDGTVATEYSLPDSTTFLQNTGMGTTMQYSVDQVDANAILEAGSHMGQYTYDNDLPSTEEDSPHTLTKNISYKGVSYDATMLFVYRFYVTNYSETSAYYRYALNITGQQNSVSTGQKLSDQIRVRIYDNRVGSGEHKYMDYAAHNVYKDGSHRDLEDASGETDSNGNKILYTTDDYYDSEHRYTQKQCDEINAYINEYCDVNSTEHPFTYFSEKSPLIQSASSYSLGQNEIDRITFLVWVEGYDPDGYADFPGDAELRLSFFVAAAEKTA